ncbi:hypothetical protein L596_026204 [Steinernema carpocapsae]|uniref:Uncharacterized protein n=1 Tax=Steinernema carpocapsae TaxID=34508 RepID=A0A4V5ZY42_STECR|nr:hypothetical protein L596_026204 [Steinernema carpocapsae]
MIPDLKMGFSSKSACRCTAFLRGLKNCRFLCCAYVLFGKVGLLRIMHKDHLPISYQGRRPSYRALKQ